MKILGIETSCDDTCGAILEIKEGQLDILSNVVSSQIEIHRKWGGVYPTLAVREHQKNLPLVLNKVFKKAGNPQINSMGVTVGPGLEPCLWQGINFAKDLSQKKKAPLVPVNHIEAHIVANFLSSKNFSLLQKDSRSIFPAVCLVVSGGHTQLILAKKIGQYKILGETRDDAAGECLDKTARILGLGYPGGPAIQSQASKLQKLDSKLRVQLPRPMINSKNYDFSFSGLKTAVLYDFKSRPPKIRKSKEYLQAISAEIQQSIIDVLIKKTIQAAKNFQAKAIILGGGVCANDQLREQFKSKIKKLNIRFLVPLKKFCTDNGAMVGLAAFFHRKETTPDIRAKANLKIGKNFP